MLLAQIEYIWVLSMKILSNSNFLWLQSNIKLSLQNELYNTNLQNNVNKIFVISSDNWSYYIVNNTSKQNIV